MISRSAVLFDRVQIATPRLQSLGRMVRTAGESILKRRASSNKNIADALDGISSCLTEGLHQFSELDQRALINWKGDLDYFQAKDAENSVHITVSDSILTERQLFFIRVNIVNPLYRQGTNQIMFHKTKQMIGLSTNH